MKVDLACSSQQASGTPFNFWTKKQKARRIVLKPQSKHIPSLTTPIVNQKGSVNSSNLLNPQGDDALLQQQHKTQANSATEKPNNNSKSQLAVRRQRSALWVAKVHLLNLNMSNNVKKVNPNNSVQMVPKDLSTTHCYASPKGTKTSFSINMQQAQLRTAQSGSPGAIVQNKTKKQSIQQARTTVDKMLKKKVSEQLALFVKAGMKIPNSNLTVPTSKVGEVFSSLVKNTSNKADSHLDIVQILRAGTRQASTKGMSKRKKYVAPSTKQILSSMGLHTPLSIVAPGNVGTILYQSKNQPPNTVMNFNSTARQTGKMTQPMSKNPRRNSQSRLETFETQKLQAQSKKMYQMPIAKFKKRLKQHMANQQLQSFQESLFNQQPREIRTAQRQGRTKNILSRSKSNSPSKKTSSRVTNMPRPLTKRSNNHTKRTTSQFGDFNKAKESRSGDFSAFNSLETNQIHMDNMMAKQGRIQKQAQNLNHKNVTGDKHDDSNLAQHADDKTKELLEKASSVQDQSDQDSQPERQSIADEDQGLDPEAAQAMLRQLQKLGVLRATATDDVSDGDEQLSRQLSHRSHDNLGYVSSPLLLVNSIEQSINEARQYSERKFQLSVSSSEDKSEENGILDNEAQIGFDQVQEQFISSPLLEEDIPSDDRHFVQNLHQQSNKTAMDMHVKTHMSNYLATKLSGLALSDDKQTATDKAYSQEDSETDPLQNTRNRQLPPIDKNRDVTDYWPQEEASEYSIQDDLCATEFEKKDNPHKKQDELAQAVRSVKFGSRFAVAQTMNQPKSPSSNLSIASVEDSRSAEVISADLTSFLAEEELNEQPVIPDEHLSFPILQ